MEQLFISSSLDPIIPIHGKGNGHYIVCTNVMNERLYRIVHRRQTHHVSTNKT